MNTGWKRKLRKRSDPHRFDTAPLWLRPILRFENSLLHLVSPYLPTTAHLLGEGQQQSNLETTDLGIESAERLTLGDNASPYLPQHVERYVWAMQQVGGRTVIDFGCGEGYGAEMLGWAARKSIGIDISQSAISRASAQFRHAEYLCMDLGNNTSLPKAELGTCFEVLEHLPDPSVSLNAIAASVDRLLVSIPNPLIGGTHINPHHYSDRTIGVWKDLIRRAAAQRGEGLQPPKIRLYHQGIRSPIIRRGASITNGFWLFDIRFDH